MSCGVRRPRRDSIKTSHSQRHFRLLLPVMHHVDDFIPGEGACQVAESRPILEPCSIVYGISYMCPCACKSIPSYACEAGFDRENHFEGLQKCGMKPNILRGCAPAGAITMHRPDFAVAEDATPLSPALTDVSKAVCTLRASAADLRTRTTSRILKLSSI